LAIYGTYVWFIACGWKILKKKHPIINNLLSV
jgi:hypothetical protein